MNILFFKNLIKIGSSISRLDHFKITNYSQIQKNGNLFFKSFTSDTLPPVNKNETSSSIDELAKELSNNKKKSPYIFFVKDNYKIESAKYPGKLSSQIISSLSTQWKSMSFEEKMIYFNTAEKNNMETEKKLKELTKNLSPKEKNDLKKRLKLQCSERRKKTSKRRIKQEKAKLNRPKKPDTPFILYMKTLDRGDAPITEFVKGSAMKWKSLAEEDKKVFIDEFQKKREKHKADLKDWEAKMIIDGHQKLVRKSSMRKLTKTLEQPKEKMIKMKEAYNRSLLKKEKNLLKRIQNLKDKMSVSEKKSPKKKTEKVKNTEKIEVTSKTSQQKTDKKKIDSDSDSD